MFDKLAFLEISPPTHRTLSLGHIHLKSFSINPTMHKTNTGNQWYRTGLSFVFMFPGQFGIWKPGLPPHYCYHRTRLSRALRFNKAKSLPLIQQPHRVNRTSVTPTLQSNNQRLSNLPKLRLKQIQDLKLLNYSSDSSCWFAESISSENYTLLIT